VFIAMTFRRSFLEDAFQPERNRCMRVESNNLFISCDGCDLAAKRKKGLISKKPRFDAAENS
jgi:hypothetical protein